MITIDSILLVGVISFLYMLLKELKHLNYQVQNIYRQVEYRNLINVPDMDD